MSSIDLHHHHDLVAITERYMRLRDSKAIQSLLLRGGELHIASEGRTVAMIETLLRQGHLHFSEKYCQELLKKWSDEKIKYFKKYISFFGAIQSNKAKKILKNSNSIEGISNLQSALKFQKLSVDLGYSRRFFLQVNIDREKQKSGCFPEKASYLLNDIRYKVGLEISGVMIIPRINTNPKNAFRWTREFSDKHHLQHCVMGMSSDYLEAIDCGATIVRIGRLIWNDPAQT